MQLFGSKEKIIDKIKNGENAPSLELVEVVLAQSKLVDNQYQQKYEVFYTFISNKSYDYLLNVDHITISFTDQNGRPLEIKDKVSLTLLINK